MRKNQIKLENSGSNWSVKVKVLRLCWTLCYPLVFYLPQSMNILRVSLLRLFGAKIGKHCLVSRKVKVWMPWNLEMERSSVLGREVEIYNFGKVYIGASSVLSQYTYLCTATHDYTNQNHTLVWKNIDVGSNCWIAAGVFISPGVTVGDGAVIGAHSVVTKDVDPWVVCAGNPAKKIKDRILTDE